MGVDFFKKSDYSVLGLGIITTILPTVFRVISMRLCLENLFLIREPIPQSLHFFCSSCQSFQLSWGDDEQSIKKITCLLLLRLMAYLRVIAIIMWWLWSYKYQWFSIFLFSPAFSLVVVLWNMIMLRTCLLNKKLYVWFIKCLSFKRSWSIFLALIQVFKIV